MTRINGVVYDMNLISFQVPAGDVEEGVFRTDEQQRPRTRSTCTPSFQVHAEGRWAAQPVPPGRSGRKDTVLLHDRETVTVRLGASTAAIKAPLPPALPQARARGRGDDVFNLEVV